MENSRIECLFPGLRSLVLERTGPSLGRERLVLGRYSELFDLRRPPLPPAGPPAAPD